MTPNPSQTLTGAAKGRLTAPKSVAIVGASRLEGGSYYGGRLFDNVINAHPAATIYAINPRLAGEEISGHKVYASVRDLPAVPDLMVVTTPVGTVLDILEDGASLGVHTAVVISAHRGESEGQRAFDEAIAELSGRTGMQIIGPNSMGVMNAQAGLNASFTSATHGIGLVPGPIAAVAQSGAAIAYMLQVFRGTKTGFSWLISSGNEAAASIETLFMDVIDDPNTEIILLFVEGIADGVAFRKAALRAQIEGKAVLMLNSGVSEVGREAVQSHTGRIAGKPEMIRALAREAHISMAASYAQFFDAAKALSEQGIKRRAIPHGRRAVIITTSGGAGTVTSDQLSACGWTLPRLPEDIAHELAAIAKQSHVGNPVDVTGAFADTTMLPRLLRVLSRFPEVDAVFIITGAGGSLAVAVADAIRQAAADYPAELYVGWVGLTPEVADVFDGSSVSVFADPLRAVMAAEACATFRGGQALKHRSEALLAALDRPATAHRPRPGLWTAAETIADVGRFGAVTAPAERVATLDRAGVRAVAERIGYPVVLKIDSPDLNHKSDAGGVRLNLKSAEAVDAAVSDFQAIATQQDIRQAGVLVQAMMSGVEVLVGVKADDAFGHLLVVGLGGIHAELHADSAVSMLLPADEEAIEQLIDRHNTLSILLQGYRGAPACDTEALVASIAAIARWAGSYGAALQEADFNPIIVNAKGAFVVDGRAVMAGDVQEAL
ncbi:MAG TPA: acetate--CoA ligase family protein [Xanthobacteraceae bacterium]|nr:acetate--CoA ligase family protein [Xanthobacteraceae bacterium]